MLARRLGYAQLSEPVRFSAEWEREATLRLRSGDISVLTDYAERARLHGGSPEQATEQAYRAWLADHLAGHESLLMARTEEQAAELSRRARADLQRYGLVSARDEVRLRNHAWASTGDLVMARSNDRRVIAGQPGRWLTNRDVLQIIDTRPGEDAVVARLWDGHGGDGGQPSRQPFCMPKDYLRRECQLAYACTQHSAQGRTVDTAHVLADALCDRQGLYVAMSRGRDANHAYVITTPRAADVREGSRPAPELAREQALARERAGLDAQPAPGGEDEVTADPESVLAQVLRRDGAELSATETLQRELSDADHLGVLGARWQDLAQKASRERFERALRDILPSVLADEALADPAVTWLWRSLRYAEAAGLDGPQTLARAAAARSLYDAHNVARVLDSRVRYLLTGVEPVPPGPWSQRVPDLGDPELNRFMRQLAEAMDERAARLGEHSADAGPLWARQALGPVPGDLVARADWERRASAVASYREMYGYAHPADPIGPAPAKTSPEARAAWRAALAALGRIDGIDLRDATDGKLWVLRGMYERETSWAPPHVGEELRLVRLAGHDARVDAVRAEHEASAAVRAPDRARQQETARIWRAVEAKAAQEEATLAAAQATRIEWERMTGQTRRVAMAADVELRRRHPEEFIEPLRSAEPEGITVQPTAEASEHPAPDGAGQPGSAPGTAEESAAREALGLTPERAAEEIPAQLQRVREAARRAQDLLDGMRGMRMPALDDDLEPGQAWDILAGRDRDAILQPPAPDVPPSPAVTRLAGRAAARPGPTDPQPA